MENYLWDKEEFEEYVAKGIIGLLEPTHKMQKKTNQAVNPKQKDIKKIKSHGTYYPPRDRLYDVSGEIDLRVDTIPNLASLAFGCVSQKSGQLSSFVGDDDNLDGYLQMHWLERKKSLPKKWHSTGPGSPFSVYWAYAREEGGLLFCKDIVTICYNSGKISPCYFIDQWQDGYRHQTKIFEGEKDESGRHKSVRLASAIILAWNERLSFWNVQAVEGAARVLFGVYPEQIQSLFYARDLPKTKTGRKSPILHWVSAHKRRMKSGTEVDIESHLRGTNKFEMNGTLFEITRPQKCA